MSKTVEGGPSRRLVIFTVIRDHEVTHGLYRPLQDKRIDLGTLLLIVLFLSIQL